MTFINIDFVGDADQLADDATEYLETSLPGWEPADGNLEVWLIEALARMTSEAVEVARAVPPQVFAAFGQQFLGVAQRTGAYAECMSTWVVESAQGYVIPAGTLVAYRTSGDTALLFATVVDVPVAVGFTSAAGVLLRAVAVGSTSNGVASATVLELVDSLSYVTSVTVSSPSAGGVDPESDGSYLDRLATETRLLTPRPILPGDFAVLAARTPGVYRALGISGYDPDDESTDNERMVTVALVDAEGQPVDSAVADACRAYLDGFREVNFIVNTCDPEYTPVNVTYSLAVSTGFVGSEVVARVNETLAGLLDPAVWGGGDASPPSWAPGSNVVRYHALSAYIASVAGVAYVVSLAINGSPADVTLAGIAPLPTAGTITGTVVT